MFVDICPHCDGTGERDWISGARCYECNGKGFIEEDDDFDPEDEPDWLREDDEWNSQLNNSAD